jgi:hypothetical protein
VANHRNRGAVLIVVLGVLAILALLATTFATLQATEKQVSRNYLDTVRAKLLAQSGLQDAEARLREYFPFRYFDAAAANAPKPWKFWSADVTETVEPPPKDRVEDAKNPSFAVEMDPDPTDPNVKPRLLRIDGKERGLSGTHGSGTYARHGDHYVLKVSDLSGRLYVNDGLDGGPDGSVSQNLKRLLNVLGEILQVPRLGDQLLAVRPAAGYRHPQEMLKAVAYDEALFNRFKDHVTTYAWVDPCVANPVPLSMGKLADYPVQYYRGTPPVFRHGSMVSGKDSKGDDVTPPGGLNTCPQVCAGGAHDNPAIRVYGLDTLNPQWIEIVARAPVNPNAASREVLVALLTDLRGFFLADRRRNNPRWKGDLYLSFKQQNTLSPDRTEGDEIGFLMETVPIVGPGGTATDGISAFVLADEIIACRNRRASANFNYSAVPWAGPFRTWRQFYQFVDNLALPKAEGGAGVIDDTRPLHFDYEEEIDDPAGYGALVDSAVQRRHATKAIADVLKANFNPNLHLNELNPDENLYLRVDKTDLVVNSTEFCFMPTGYFEVESLGRIVKARDSFQDPDAYLVDTALVAQAKVTAVYKLYDQYRETHQKQFYAGDLPPRVGAFETNNDLSLEVGPEPDNGVFPGNLGAPGEPDNEWGGSIGLPTVGGVFGGHGAPRKSKNTLVGTLSLPGAPHLGAAMHGHFTCDFHLCHSIVDRNEMASQALGPDDPCSNYGDSVQGQTLSYGGPYAPNSGPGGNAVPLHRLSKSFRLAYNASTGTVSAPALAPYAPSDLRIDGGYTERHAGPAYFVQKSGRGLWNFNQENASGMVSFWIKPSFFPELTGKVRAFWDMSRYHEPCGQNVHVWPWAQWFYPSNYQTGPGGISENTGPRYWYNNCGQFQPCSFVWGSKQWHSSSSGQLPRSHSFGKLTACLNHEGHDDCVKLNRASPTVKPSPFRAHRWLNTTFSWNLTGTRDNSGFLVSKMYVNGVGSRPGSPYIPYTYTSMTGGWAEGYDKMYFFDKHDGGEFNQMRLGAPSVIARAAVCGDGSFRGNYTGDHTVDELYVWKSAAEGDPLILWQRGRYYKPLDEAYGEGRFTSQAISLAPTPGRVPPPPSVSGAPAPASLPVPTPPVRILGLSWTWFGEDVNAETGKPAVYDYNTPLGVAESRLDVEPRVRVGIKDGNATWGLYDEDAFSAVRAPDGSIPAIQDPSQVRYVVQFKLEKAQLDTILLATPVLDDVTVYYDDGRSPLLSYSFDGRSF